jgi:hypothetical protein
MIFSLPLYELIVFRLSSFINSVKVTFRQEYSVKFYIRKTNYFYTFLSWYAHIRQRRFLHTAYYRSKQRIARGMFVFCKYKTSIFPAFQQFDAIMASMYYLQPKLLYSKRIHSRPVFGIDFSRRFHRYNQYHVLPRQPTSPKTYCFGAS